MASSRRRYPDTGIRIGEIHVGGWAVARSERADAPNELSLLFHSTRPTWGWLGVPAHHFTAIRGPKSELLKMLADLMAQLIED